MAEQKNNLQQAKKAQASPAERFTKTVLRQAGENLAGTVNLTEYQKSLIQGYFIQIDSYFKDRKRNTNNYNWNQVNMNDLATLSVKCAKLGLDMMTDNTLHVVPYFTKDTGKVTVNLQLGFNGKKTMAYNFAADELDDVITQLVYSTDKFKVTGRNEYEFEITNPFNRGELVGGFGYIKYKDPTKNKLVIASLEDLNKRRNKAQTQMIWNQWPTEMYQKTLDNIVFNQRNIRLDPRKITEEYEYLMNREQEANLAEAQADIEANANEEYLDFEDSAYVVDYEENVPVDEKKAQEEEIVTEEATKEPEHEQVGMFEEDEAQAEIMGF